MKTLQKLWVLSLKEVNYTMCQMSLPLKILNIL